MRFLICGDEFDDDMLIPQLELYLEGQRHDVGFVSLESIRRASSIHSHDVLVFDARNVSIEDGAQFIRDVRRKQIGRMVLMAIYGRQYPSSARIPTLVNWLAAGADHFCDLPVHFNYFELQATRAHESYANADKDRDAKFRIGDLEIFPDQGAVKLGDVFHSRFLTKQEMGAFIGIVEQNGSVATKDHILMRMREMFPGSSDPKIVDVVVCKIRRKLAAIGLPDFIETSWGRGYLVPRPDKKEPHTTAAPIQAGISHTTRMIGL